MNLQRNIKETSDGDEENYCCELHMTVTRINDYDGVFYKYYCPICQTEYVESEDEY